MSHRHQLPPQQSFYPPTYSTNPPAAAAPQSAVGGPSSLSWGAPPTAHHAQPQLSHLQHQQSPQQQQHHQQQQGLGGYVDSDEYGHPHGSVPVDPNIAAAAGDHAGRGGTEDLDAYSDSPGPGGSGINTRSSGAGGAYDGANGLDGQGEEKKKPTRGARACLHCRRLKVCSEKG